MDWVKVTGRKPILHLLIKLVNYLANDVIIIFNTETPCKNLITLDKTNC